MKIDPAPLEWKKAHELLVSAIMPRPVALISTVSADGVYNVAPYSFFTPITTQPMLVGFEAGRKKDGRKKDTLVNIEATGDFVVNVVNQELARAANKASANYRTDEFKEVGLTPVKADLVRSPLVAESPIHLECRLVQVLEFGRPPQRGGFFVIGEVVLVHVDDRLHVDEDLEVAGWGAVGHMGGETWCRTGDTFKLNRAQLLV